MNNPLSYLKIKTKLLIGFSIISLILLYIGLKEYNSLTVFEAQKNYIINNVHTIEVLKEAKYLIRTAVQSGSDMARAATSSELESTVAKQKEMNEQVFSTFKNIKVNAQSISEEKYQRYKLQLIEIFDKAESDYKNIILPSIGNISEAILDLNHLMTNGTTISGASDTTAVSNDLGVLVRIEEKSRESKIELCKSKVKKSSEYIYLTGNEIIKDLSSAEQITKNLTEEIQKTAESITDHSKYNVSIWVLLGIVLSILIAIYLSDYIAEPVVRLKEYIYLLAQGELPGNIENSTNDEVGDMTHALNLLVEGLKKTSDFSIEIGKGNFSSFFEPLSESDVLGNSLLAMRESLKEAKAEEEKRKVEDEIRSWTNEGLAKFAEILRFFNGDLEGLGSEIIKNLVKYININQGGIYLFHEDDKTDSYIELLASFAYNRKKYLKKTIQPGEGLIGMCILQKYTMYLKEIPDDYIEIESGLGLANPRCLLIVPLKMEDNVLGAIELASFVEMKKHEIEFVEKIADSIASAIASIKINQRTAELLEQSKIHATEMQLHDEQMRLNMEDLRATQEEALAREEGLRNALKAMEDEKALLIRKMADILKENEELSKLAIQNTKN